MNASSHAFCVIAAGTLKMEMTESRWDIAGKACKEYGVPDEEFTEFKNRIINEPGYAQAFMDGYYG